MVSLIDIAPSLLAQAVAQDTVVMELARDGLGTIAGIADIVVSLVLLGLLGVITVLFFQLRKIADRMHGMLQRLEMDPLLERSRSVAENVDFITLAIRSDVEKVNRSVSQLSERLAQASDLMEERIADFNALMEVVQGEAEDAFIDTASTVRGVRAGANELQEPRDRRPIIRDGGGSDRHKPEEGAPVRDEVVIEVDEE